MVDVSQSLDIAMALGVMATPSAIEVEKGLVVGYHIGGVPKDVLTRFA